MNIEEEYIKACITENEFILRDIFLKNIAKDYFKTLNISDNTKTVLFDENDYINFFVRFIRFDLDKNITEYEISTEMLNYNLTKEEKLNIRFIISQIIDYLSKLECRGDLIIKDGDFKTENNNILVSGTETLFDKLNGWHLLYTNKQTDVVKNSLDVINGMLMNHLVMVSNKEMIDKVIEKLKSIINQNYKIK